MRNTTACRSLALLVAGLGISAVLAPRAQAQISINIGAPPACPYGYYDYPPYACAPYGYYGPDWFINGVFIGAGPWFHGPGGFRGHVDNHFDPRFGYHGAVPHRGEARAPGRDVGRMRNFHGNAMRDGRGHSVGGRGH